MEQLFYQEGNVCNKPRPQIRIPYFSKYRHDPLTSQTWRPGHRGHQKTLRLGATGQIRLSTRNGIVSLPHGIKLAIMMTALKETISLWTHPIDWQLSTAQICVDVGIKCWSVKCTLFVDHQESCWFDTRGFHHSCMGTKLQDTGF